MGLDAALAIARSGLLHTQRALAASANDVANAETPGHTKKTIATRAVVVGQDGIGVRSLAPSRDVDEALVTELDSRRAAAAGAEVRLRLLQGIETAHGNPENGDGLGDLTAALRTGFEDLRADPSEAGRQTSVVMDATALATRLNEISRAVGDARQQAQDGVVAEVARINDVLRQVADLTLRIRDEIALTGSAAALEDRRDTAIATLSESIEVRALKREDGGLVLVARNGLVLPLDPRSDAFSTADAMLGPTAFHGAGGSIPGIMLGGRDVTGVLAGGRLAEYVALRDQTLPRYQSELDLAAANTAARFEAQGLRLFTDATGAVPDAALPYAASTMVGFAGTIRVNAAVEGNPALLRDGTHAVVDDPAGPSAFTPNPAGGPASFVTLLDRVLDFTFGAQAQANVAWAPIATGGLGPDGTLSSPFGAPPTLEGYTALLTATQTADRNAASAALAGAEAMKQGLETRFNQRSGVDVDSEMAAMVTLQNAYAANARVMSTVQAMWDALLGAVR
ncbi:flagellar hook-associated protein FlgK [Roseomonas fluvialis]|uniref:Flagellar hook-associated protein 1 n=1 Tax=Roseomonas fluvialis TaxID=1750527 RepID=A0ABN6P785_9PROT|nr:flagellar basal body rod C-terminal domain-containing protein [Roseomonas fluvialis]BDG73572.1 flagellar hook-associated protein [Roseomonas fluvialis]